MCANAQNNLVKYHHSESFIHFTYFEAISLGGVVYLPRKKPKEKPVCLF